MGVSVLTLSWPRVPYMAHQLWMVITFASEGVIQKVWYQNPSTERDLSFEHVFGIPFCLQKMFQHKKIPKVINIIHKYLVIALGF